MRKFNVTVNGNVYEVEVEEVGAEATVATPAPKAAAPAPKAAAPKAGNGAPVNAPMPGTILKINNAQGDSVKKGDVLCILEAMKMENEIMAPADGTITSVCVKKGDSVTTGAVLFTIA